MDFFSRVIEFLFFTISSDYSIVSRESVATQIGQRSRYQYAGQVANENAFCSSATSFRQTWNALLYKLCRRVAPGEEKYYPLKKTGDSTSSALQKRDTGAATKRFSSCWPGAFPLAHAAKGQLTAFRSRPGTCRLTVTTPHCVRVAASLTDDGSGQSFRTRGKHTNETRKAESLFCGFCLAKC